MRLQALDLLLHLLLCDPFQPFLELLQLRDHFTVPRQLRALIRSNQKLLYDLLLRDSAGALTLLRFAQSVKAIVLR